MSKSLVVVYEAPADFTTATELADRVLVAEIDWLDETLLDSQRQWVREGPGGTPLTWTSIRDRARDMGMMGLRIAGHFDGEPGQADAHAARRAIRYIRATLGEIAAIVLIRDADDQGERRVGLDQARREHARTLPIVVGLAVRMREAWVLCGFEPEDEKEGNNLTAETQTLGFDPRILSHELTDRKQHLPRNPKRVLEALTLGDRDRQRRCWSSTPLETLKERGHSNGLADYLDEVKTHLAPLIAVRRGKP